MMLSHFGRKQIINDAVYYPTIKSPYPFHQIDQRSSLDLYIPDNKLIAKQPKTISTR